MSAVVVRQGTSYLAINLDNSPRWVENPGDAFPFANGGAATAYLTGAGITSVVEQLTVSGQDDDSLRSDNS